MLAYPLSETDVPNGTYPSPQLDPYSNRPFKPSGLGVRVRTRWRRARLDDELAGGVSPMATGSPSRCAARP